MGDDRHTSEELQKQLNDIAGKIVTVDVTDMPLLVELSETFKQLSTDLAGSYPRSSVAAANAAQILEWVVLEERENPRQDISNLEQMVTVMQQVVEHGGDAEAGYAEELVPDDAAVPAASAASETASDQSSAEGGESEKEVPDQGGAGQEDSAAGATDEAPKQQETVPQTEADPELTQPVPVADPDLAGEFITESREHFDTADESLMTLEENPADEEAISAVFRAFHTIKGAAGMLELTPISKLAHRAETLLGAVRDGKQAFSGEVPDETFAALDTLKEEIRQVEEALSNGTDYSPNPQIPEIVARLDRLQSGEAEQKPQGQASSAGESSGQEEDAVARESGGDGTQAQDSSEAGRGQKNEADETAATQATGSAEAETAESKADTGAQQSGRKKQPKSGGDGGGTAVKQTMKIDADKIDNLVDAIGELVISESIVTDHQALSNVDSADFNRHLNQLSKITRSLQDMAMSMRMVPVEATFKKMSRLVRDLAKKAGKDVKLSMSGQETEIDKAMIEKLGDPMVHLVRNAVDHGIEPTPEDRASAGKPRQATIALRAYHEGGSIHIQIADDGRGLDREAIAQRAVERGVVSDTSEMSDEEVFSLIFEPGFSTAKQVTDVSGRGVGMDVVKSNIESLRGNVRIESEKGKGTAFTLVLPLTMAIIDGMQAKVGDHRYIIPLLSIIQSFKPTEDMIHTMQGKGEMVPFRGNLVPLCRMSRLFNLEGAVDNPTQGTAVVVEDAGRQVAVLVDELLGQTQTVIKSMGKAMGELPGLTGATILSDGTPGLIIDVHGMVNMASGRSHRETQSA